MNFNIVCKSVLNHLESLLLNEDGSLKYVDIVNMDIIQEELKELGENYSLKYVNAYYNCIKNRF